jgi:hypothetical protein
MSATAWNLKTFDAGPPLETPAAARVKILQPMITTGPSMHAEILSLDEHTIRVRVPRLIVIGYTVQVRSGQRVAFGSVRAAVQVGAEYEIEVDVERLS